MNLAQSIYSVPLISTGNSGVLIPEPEISKPKLGVSDTFLVYAKEYFKKYKNYDYLYLLISETFKRLNYTPSGLVVDFGSGFGNSVIPMLENYDVSVVAIDISKDLLEILNDEARQRGYQDRCASVCQDAQNFYFKPNSADLVVGCAVLHHMINPMLTIKSACQVLKPGGKAIFFEPFELGHQVLRIAYLRILKEANERNCLTSVDSIFSRMGLPFGLKSRSHSKGFDYLRALNVDIDVRTHRNKHPTDGKHWEKIDDKWLFCSKHFEKIASEVGCTIEVLPLHDNKKQFTRQTRNALEAYGGMKCPDALPNWAWKILGEYDEDYFSPEGLLDLPIEACVVITSPSL
jgi:SAM-dependent methyltransferase